MQVPRFSPRISLIEMAPRPAPRSGYPSRPALPLPCPVCHHRQIDRQTPLLLLYIILRGSENKKKPSLRPMTFTQMHSFFTSKYFLFILPKQCKDTSLRINQNIEEVP